jgi:hypothetical protein
MALPEPSLAMAVETGASANCHFVGPPLAPPLLQPEKLPQGAQVQQLETCFFDSS